MTIGMINQPPTANHPVAIYAVSPHPDGQSYDVQIVGTDGSQQTMLGFENEGFAQTWIAIDQVRDQLRLPPE